MLTLFGVNLRTEMRAAISFATFLIVGFAAHNWLFAALVGAGSFALGYFVQRSRSTESHQMLADAPAPVRAGFADATTQTATSTAAPAGWYDDPENPGRHRWFDGSAWTQHTR